VGIRDRLAAHDAKFISFGELLTAIAEAEGVTIQEVARAWSLEPLLRTLKPVLRLHDDGDFAEGGGDAHHYELQCALNGGKAWMDEAAQSELGMGEPGFFREDAENVLLAAGWSPHADLIGKEGASVAKPAPSNRARPDLLAFVPRVNIALGDAARILGDEHSAGAWGRWRDALADAVDAGRILAGSWGMDRDEQTLSHADIRAWCKASGITWPVPLPEGCESDAAAVDANLRAELDKARECIAELERERAGLLEKIGEGGEPPAWTRHDTRLFRLLPAWIKAAQSGGAWEKQETLVPAMAEKYRLTKADAKALDAVTRPDSLRKKQLLP